MGVVVECTWHPDSEHYINIGSDFQNQHFGDEIIIEKYSI